MSNRTYKKRAGIITGSIFFEISCIDTQVWYFKAQTEGNICVGLLCFSDCLAGQEQNMLPSSTSLVKWLLHAADPTVFNL